MKVKRKISLLLTSIVWVGLLITICQPAFAQEGLGGAVQTNGEIGFYQDSVIDSSTPPTSSTPPSVSQSEPVVKPTPKPQGRYPSTGELVKKSLSISGVLLVLLVLFFVLFKRKKEGTKE